MSNIILLVDDDHATCALYERHLTHQGWSVKTAHDYESAEEAVMKYQPAAIVLDVLLKDHRSGWDLLDRLRSWQWSRNLPVLVVSAVDEPHKAMASGATGFMLKPCSPTQIVSRLQDYLAIA
jgi:DNA-binding response OmpR family regulator